MGTDVYIGGELTIPAGKVPEAEELLRDAMTVKGYEIPDNTISALDLIESQLQRIGVTLEDDGSLTFGVEDSIRHEDYDQWIFEALAPVIDDGEFDMEGDGYKWMWEIRAGKFRVVDSETVYDMDHNAAPTIEKLVALIYPDALKGRPVTVIPPEERSTIGDDSDILCQIENLLRETGYGPQAGMNELERLAEVE